MSHNVNPYSTSFYNNLGCNPTEGINSANNLLLLQQWQAAQMLQHAVTATTPPPPPLQQQPIPVDDEVENERAGTSVASTTHVEEEIAKPSKRLTTKGKEVAEKKKWSENECVILTRSWVHATEDAIKGNGQTENVFWTTIERLFNTASKEGYRNISQLHGKWNKIKAGCKNFGTVFKRFSDEGRQSGADEKHIYDVVHEQYKREYGPSRFAFEKCWEILKGFPTFWNDHGTQKQATWVDLGDDGEPGTQNPAVDNLFGDDPIKRPLGRNVSRKLSQSSDAGSSRSSTGSEALLKLDEMLKLQRDVLQKSEEDRKKFEEDRKARKASRRRKEVMDVFNFLQNPVPRDMPR
uniref:uncharacterized protein LOC122587880 n=1 Tax=Erigeron canadensis TaxID=72917 RepID=UPI001CB8A52B|nr:uncharacterized protein LOC122587880 [Erigeron canadensis]